MLVIDGAEAACIEQVTSVEAPTKVAVSGSGSQLAMPPPARVGLVHWPVIPAALRVPPFAPTLTRDASHEPRSAKAGAASTNQGGGRKTR